jgi:hypothetical protein
MKVLLIIPFLICCMQMLQAQQATTASGGNLTGSSGTISYTLGLVCYENNTNTNGSITQGVQQPFEILLIGDPGNDNAVPLCSVFPNPVSELVTVRFTDLNTKNLVIRLFDCDSKLLKQIKITSDETPVSFQAFASGTYVLEVIDSQKVIRSFKIIKTNHP